MSALRESYARDGYAVVRGVFTPAEVAEMKSRFDVWRADMLAAHDATFVKGNFRVWVNQPDGQPASARVLRGIQWPSYADAVLDRYRTDPRLFAIASALIGPDVKQARARRGQGAARSLCGLHPPSTPPRVR